MFFTLYIKIYHIVLYGMSVIYKISFISNNDIIPHVRIFSFKTNMLEGHSEIILENNMNFPTLLFT